MLETELCWDVEMMEILNNHTPFVTVSHVSSCHLTIPARMPRCVRLWTNVLEMYVCSIQPFVCFVQFASLHVLLVLSSSLCSPLPPSTTLLTLTTTVFLPGHPSLLAFPFFPDVLFPSYPSPHLPWCDPAFPPAPPTQWWSAMQCPTPFGRAVQSSVIVEYMCDSIAKFDCPAGTTLVGANNVTCRENGTWSNDFPSCVSLGLGDQQIGDNRFGMCVFSFMCSLCLSGMLDPILLGTYS